MDRAEVVYQTRKTGGGTVWVRRRRGGWRAITFDSAPTTLGKLLGLSGVLLRIGSATTTVVAGMLQVAQAVPSPEHSLPMLPRPGPVSGPVQIAGP
jgi:hypothetical protein